MATIKSARALSKASRALRINSISEIPASSLNITNFAAGRNFRISLTILGKTVNFRLWALFEASFPLVGFNGLKSETAAQWIIQS